MTIRAVALVLALLALQACTRVGTAGAPGGGNTWTEHGVLRIAGLGDPDTLNPLIGTSQIIVDLSMFWAGYLFNIDDRERLVPELATEVPSLNNGAISPDGRTIVYHLRPGVLWHDGKPFTAADVVFTWRAVMNPRNNVGSRLGYDLVTAIDVRDAHTVAVHLSRPYAPFVATFFAPSSTSIPVLPAHLLAGLPDLNRIAYNAQPIGTGPFVVDHWNRGEKIVFRANPRYWRGRPGLQRVEYDPVADENTVLTQLEAHEIDLEFYAPAAQLGTMRNIPGYRMWLTPFTGYSQIEFNTRSPLVSDARVRQALAYAVDTERMRQAITHGVGIPGDSDQPAFLWAHASGLPRYGYDAVRARALLDAAGWRMGPGGVRTKDGRKLAPVISSITGSATGQMAEVLVQHYWRDVGVDAEIKNYSDALFFSAYNAGGILLGGKFDAAFLGWFNGLDPDDSNIFMCDEMPPKGQNSYFLCDPAIDAAERTALGSYDLAVRKKAYDAIQRRLFADEPLIVLWDTRRIDIANTDLRGFRPAHVATDFWNTWQYRI